ncbi:hypothetical protein EDEG_02993 [Edhazardia aedis USNM 41457]|uniref:C3H1-type domain-containing protein n=1 Tax=Edhazardia aedis (strain USNM 41457) TaxID=1003232 RepID=J9D488_EDHAE|nr:hypothetical protein EDEG_02993 [Edhazardia aedis USNM 41457]|eukprot:EJW02596.1 hypothetical protein EDEG_02993 [Edhazardia aedis USNM 41457]
MAKPKKNEKPKTAKEVKKEIEDKTFGMKNKKKSREVKKQIDKISTIQQVEKKKKKEELEKNRIHLVQPKAPAGVDPKTIPCVYYLNQMCEKGDKCKYGHEKKLIKQEIETEKVEDEQSKLVCRFLVDAINEGQYLKNWKCPNDRCKDIHKLNEVGDTEITLEEFIELSRQTLSEKLTPLTEETFKRWKEKRKREDELHKKRVDALKKGISGTALFKERPDVFVDDEEAVDVDYKERNYKEEDDDDEEYDEISKCLDNMTI